MKVNAEDTFLLDGMLREDLVHVMEANFFNRQSKGLKYRDFTHDSILNKRFRCIATFKTAQGSSK